MKLIFLDIDGVLNHLRFNEDAQTCPIDEWCAQRLNDIIKATGAELVITSAWRYMIFGSQMTGKGFEYLLRSHGIRANIHGWTVSDEVIPARGNQISFYFRIHKRPAAYVVLDDNDDGISKAGHPFVRTVGVRGLTSDDADLAVKILNQVKR